MNYLLDSNIVSDLYNKDSDQHEIIRQKFGTLKNTDHVYISILTLYEMEYGYANAPDSKKQSIRQQVEFINSDFEILPLDKNAASIFGELKKSVQTLRSLSSKKMIQHTVDIALAANAVLSCYTLVSDDKLYLDLAKLDQRLRVENWLVI